jgi:hypothetical protein
LQAGGVQRSPPVPQGARRDLQQVCGARAGEAVGGGLVGVACGDAAGLRLGKPSRALALLGARPP